ncbi:aminoglycoside phosphotransferase family protein [Vallitalea pronyensis]|uniref:Aminoglycoside phosphotransferase family protein n=1 Tax=Vallitalea pronyensis TaxID=1348613 RepID=A0A8J8SFT5_9FIRM|nr:aminoglycoside phosphotransferase family protein [Vallitalea pronyensis]QUI21672.1 aminoglycoside phosphotransferase family protein [Vallitalea pronyensis]
MKKSIDYIKVINKKYPNIKVANSRFIEEGQNNIILVVNDAVIFRFPRNEVNRATLEDEYKILMKLGESLPLNIPNPQYSFIGKDINNTFIGYPLIRGLVMKKDVFAKAQNKEKLADQLALFLKKLHSEQILKQVDSLFYSVDVRKKWLDLYDRIKEKLFFYMKEDAVKNVTHDFEVIFSALSKSSFKNTLVHGDFGPSNIIVNERLDAINGIIDFGSAHIGDPAGDIASLIGPFGYGLEFVNLMKNGYSSIGDYLERAQAYTHTFALQEALYGIENDDKRAFEAGIKEYRF